MSGPKERKKARTLHVYKSYNFVDKDPVIDFARTAVQSSKMTMRQIHERSNVSRTTLYGWFKRRTRRPQFAPIAAVLIACGVREINLDKIRRGK